MSWGKINNRGGVKINGGVLQKNKIFQFGGGAIIRNLRVDDVCTYWDLQIDFNNKEQ